MTIRKSIKKVRRLDEILILLKNYHKNDLDKTIDLTISEIANELEVSISSTEFSVLTSDLDILESELKIRKTNSDLSKPTRYQLEESTYSFITLGGYFYQYKVKLEKIILIFSSLIAALASLLGIVLQLSQK